MNEADRVAQGHTAKMGNNNFSSMTSIKQKMQEDKINQNAISQAPIAFSDTDSIHFSPRDKDDSSNDT